MTRTFENTYRWLVPSWLTEGDGYSVLRSLTRQIDENVARFREGLNARFPSRAIGTDGALARIGQDRGIIQGRSETDEHYAQRLVAWRYPRGHRVRGSAFALLNQVSEYWGGVACQTIDANGTVHERRENGAERYAYGLDWTWDDQPPSNWSRFWLVLDGTSFAGAVEEIGGEYWSDADTLGQTGVTFDDVQAMRRLLTGRAWRPAGTQPEWVVVVIDHDLAPEPVAFDASFDETFGALTWSTPVSPDATWAHWSAQDGLGVQRPTRSAGCRYWSLDPEHNNTYGGDPDLFCLASQMPSGADYAGDPDAFSTGATLWGGSTYAGNPANFPSSVRLVDDGDPAP